MEAGLATLGLELGEVQHGAAHFALALSVSISASSRSLLMKLTICRSLTSITGASAQAPRHSHCCTVNSPSDEVPPCSMPCLSHRYYSAFCSSRSWYGRLVQTF